MRVALLLVSVLASTSCAVFEASSSLALGFAGGKVGREVLNAQVRSQSAALAALNGCQTPEVAQARSYVNATERAANAHNDMALAVALGQSSSALKAAQASCGPAQPALAAAPAAAPATGTTVAASAPAEPSFAVKKGVVAVMPLDAKDIEEKLRTLLEEEIRTVSGDRLGAKGMTVLTGETTLSILAENGVDAAKACEASCALQAARELKARLFISGTAAFAEGEYTAFVRIFESESGKQLGSLKLEGKTVKELRTAFEARASQLFDRLKVVD